MSAVDHDQKFVRAYHVDDLPRVDQIVRTRCPLCGSTPGALIVEGEVSGFDYAQTTLEKRVEELNAQQCPLAQQEKPLNLRAHRCSGCSRYRHLLVATVRISGYCLGRLHFYKTAKKLRGSPRGKRITDSFVSRMTTA